MCIILLKAKYMSMQCLVTNKPDYPGSVVNSSVAERNAKFDEVCASSVTKSCFVIGGSTTIVILRPLKNIYSK